LAEPTANEALQDAITERAVLVDRYRRGVAVRALKLLAKLEEDIIARMVALDPSDISKPSYKRARLTRMLAEVQARVDQYGKALDEDIMPELRDLARDEARFGVSLLNDIPPVVLEVVAPTLTVIDRAVMSRPFQGRVLKEWLSDHTAGVRYRVRGVISQGVAEGQTVDEMVRRVRGTRANGFKDGVMETNRRGAEALVRTAVNHVTNTAREETYAENQDLIKGVRWVATLDGKTSLICIDLDGKVFPMRSGPRPPAHPNCRSTTVPVLKSWKELGIDLKEAPEGTRASMDGQVPAKTTYDNWLRGRSPAFQDDVLGKGRAELFRKGLSVDKFVDNSGHIYTLAELRRRSG
jgi:SPP1 gp7 family putative phage head morphogenesis protein